MVSLIYSELVYYFAFCLKLLNFENKYKASQSGVGLAGLTDEWRWAPTVKALQALRGVSLVNKPAEKQEMGWFVLLDTVRHISKHLLPLLALETTLSNCLSLPKRL